MYRSELLEELMRCKYPFGKAASAVEIATDNGIFENDVVRITIARENDEECYKCTLEWK